MMITDDDPTHGIGIIQVLPVHSRHLGKRVESTSTVPVSHGTFQLGQRVSGIRQSGVQVGRYASSLSGGGSTSVGGRRGRRGIGCGRGGVATGLGGAFDEVQGVVVLDLVGRQRFFIFQDLRIIVGRVSLVSFRLPFWCRRRTLPE